MMRPGGIKPMKRGDNLKMESMYSDDHSRI